MSTKLTTDLELWAIWIAFFGGLAYFLDRWAAVLRGPKILREKLTAACRKLEAMEFPYARAMATVVLKLIIWKDSIGKPRILPSFVLSAFLVFLLSVAFLVLGSHLDGLSLFQDVLILDNLPYICIGAVANLILDSTTLAVTLYCLFRVVNSHLRMEQVPWLMLDVAVALLLAILSLTIFDSFYREPGFVVEWYKTLAATFFSGSGTKDWIRSLYSVTMLVPTIFYAAVWVVLCLARVSALGASWLIGIGAGTSDGPEPAPFVTIFLFLSTVWVLVKVFVRIWSSLI